MIMTNREEGKEADDHTAGALYFTYAALRTAAAVELRNECCGG